jgi:hypothetical protein
LFQDGIEVGFGNEELTLQMRESAQSRFEEIVVFPKRRLIEVGVGQARVVGVRDEPSNDANPLPD